MGIYPHPQQDKLIHNDIVTPEWEQWFEQTRTQINQGTPPGTVQTITATVGIKLSSPDTNIIIRIEGNTTGNTDITANPQIENGFDGQVITLEGNSSTKTVQLDDGDGLALTGGASIIIDLNDTISFHYNKAKALWIENNRSIK